MGKIRINHIPISVTPNTLRQWLSIYIPQIVSTINQISETSVSIPLDLKLKENQIIGVPEGKNPTDVCSIANLQKSISGISDFTCIGDVYIEGTLGMGAMQATLTRPINSKNENIVNLKNAINPQDATTKTDLDTAVLDVYSLSKDYANIGDAKTLIDAGNASESFLKNFSVEFFGDASGKGKLGERIELLIEDIDIGNLSVSGTATFSGNVSISEDSKFSAFASTFNGSMDLSNNVINQVGTPTLDHQASNKLYSDAKDIETLNKAKAFATSADETGFSRAKSFATDGDTTTLAGAKEYTDVLVADKITPLMSVSLGGAVTGSGDILNSEQILTALNRSLTLPQDFEQIWQESSSPKEKYSSKITNKYLGDNFKGFRGCFSFDKEDGSGPIGLNLDIFPGKFFKISSENFSSNGNTLSEIEILNILISETGTSKNSIELFFDLHLRQKNIKLLADGIEEGDAVNKRQLDTGDSTTLSTAKSFATDGDTTTLASAKAFATTGNDTLKMYVDTQDLSILKASKDYTDERTAGGGVGGTVTLSGAVKGSAPLNRALVTTFDNLNFGGKNLENIGSPEVGSDAANLQTVEKIASQATASAKAHSDAKDIETLNKAKAFATSADETGFSRAKSFATDGDTTTLASAKEYTDSKSGGGRLGEEITLVGVVTGHGHLNEELITSWGDLNLHNKIITGLRNPEQETDAVNKYTLDAVAEHNLSLAKIYAESKGSEAQSNSRTFTNDLVAQYFQYGKDYTDSEIKKEKDSTKEDLDLLENTIKLYADAGDSTTLSAAKAYTDASSSGGGGATIGTVSEIEWKSTLKSSIFRVPEPLEGAGFYDARAITGFRGLPGKKLTCAKSFFVDGPNKFQVGEYFYTPNTETTNSYRYFYQFGTSKQNLDGKNEVAGFPGIRTFLEAYEYDWAADRPETQVTYLTIGDRSVEPTLKGPNIYIYPLDGGKLSVVKNTIQDVKDPILPQDAATKNYTDARIEELEKRLSSIEKQYSKSRKNH